MNQRINPKVIKEHEIEAEGVISDEYSPLFDDEIAIENEDFMMDRE